MTLWRPIFLDTSSLLMGRPAFTASSTGFLPSIRFSELLEGGLLLDGLALFLNLLSAICFLRMRLQSLGFVSHRSGIMRPGLPTFVGKTQGFWPSSDYLTLR